MYRRLEPDLSESLAAAASSRGVAEPNKSSDKTRATLRRKAEGAGAYDRAFWYTYAANTAMMTSISLLFRYADFVSFLGGAEYELGWIVGIGMVGSLVMRLAQGVGIDRYGSRTIWMWSAAGFVLACYGHLWITATDGPTIYALRILFNTSIAGVFGASITYISRRAPVYRMAEIVGTLGTSGFVGMISGAWLGDLIFGGGPADRAHLDFMFEISAVLGIAAFVFAWLATRGAAPPLRRKQPPLLSLVRRYHPGMVLLVGVAMGFGLGLPQTFLRPFALELGIERIALFFSIYAPTAFITRISIRSLPEKIGIRPMILIGIASLSISMVCCLLVQNEWQLAVPAIFLGIAHALLFPSVVAGGSAVFPIRYRGLGTTLVLAMFDLGNLIGAPTAGAILHHAEKAGLPQYVVMFGSVAAILAMIGLAYYLSGRASQEAGTQPKVKPRRRNHPGRTTVTLERPIALTPPRGVSIPVPKEK